MHNYFYRVEGFSPDPDLRPGGSGFSVYLDRDFARDALKAKLPARGRKNLDTIAKTALHSLFGKELMIRPPYQFVDDTCLLHYVTVPGNACDLGVDGIVMSEFKKEKESWKNTLEYHPHNVDSHTQAYALLSLYLTWAHMVEAVVRPIKP